MDPEWQARIVTLEAREQIRQLPARYVWASARCDVDAMVALFTEDCLFEAPGPDGRVRLHGHEPLRAMLSKSLAKPGGVIALIHNQIIDLQGSRATGTCAMSNPVAPNGPFVGYYRDDFRREHDVWLYTARRFYTYSPQLDLSGS